MASSKCSNTLWDPIRLKWVAATPEEAVRQAFLAKMTGELGFPKGLIAVEKLTALEPNRRFDLLCYTKRGEELVPLLLVECKATPLEPTAESQVLGYNSVIKAPFLCLTNGRETRTFWQEKGKMVSVPFLPSFAELQSCLSPTSLR